jgi:hypothetical protein
VKTPLLTGEFFYAASYAVFGGIVLMSAFLLVFYRPLRAYGFHSRRITMDKISGYFIFAGLLIGALFGLTWAGSSDPLRGIATGAMAGAFVGWFIAAAVIQQKKEK